MKVFHRREKQCLQIADVKEITEFVLYQLSVTQPHDNYRELIELTLIFLGITPPRGVQFMALGAFFHQARWLSKTLYTLKIWLFRNQFRLTDLEENGLQDVCIFIVCTCIHSILLQWQLAHRTMTFCFFNKLSGVNQSVQPCQRSPAANLQDISGTWIRNLLGWFSIILQVLMTQNKLCWEP